MEHFANDAKNFGLELDEKKISSFQKFEDLLIEWNSKMNLTAVREREEIRQKHFLDSLSALKAIPEDALSLLDIGTGAGFPGIPLKIVKPELQVTLLEAETKKAKFLEHVISELSLEKIFVVNARAEDAGQDPLYRGQFDIVTARAVSSLPVLCEYALPFLKLSGLFIAQKSADAKETEEANEALQILGGEIKEIIPVELSGLSARELIVIKKNSETPEKYPRRAGMPSKRPL